MPPLEALKPGDEVRYIDVHGKLRTLTFIERVDGVIPFRKTSQGRIYSLAARYYLDGSQKVEDILQIPDEAFRLPGLYLLQFGGTTP